MDFQSQGAPFNAEQWPLLNSTLHPRVTPWEAPQPDTSSGAPLDAQGAQGPHVESRGSMRPPQHLTHPLHGGSVPAVGAGGGDNCSTAPHPNLAKSSPFGALTVNEAVRGDYARPLVSNLPSCGWQCWSPSTCQHSPCGTAERGGEHWGCWGRRVGRHAESTMPMAGRASSMAVHRSRGLQQVWKPCSENKSTS